MSEPIFTNVKVGDQVLITHPERTGYYAKPMQLAIGKVIRVNKLSFRAQTPLEHSDVTFNLQGISLYTDLYPRTAEPLTVESQARYDAWIAEAQAAKAKAEADAIIKKENDKRAAELRYLAGEIIAPLGEACAAVAMSALAEDRQVTIQAIERMERMLSAIKEAQNV